MFYTEEQIQRLEKYRKNFETAVKSGFARNVGSIALKEIEDIYDEALGSHYSYNSGCSVCVMQFIKRVGEPFLKESEIYRKRAEKKKEEAEETNRQIVKDMEVKEDSLVITTEETNNPPKTKTNKRKKKE